MTYIELDIDDGASDSLESKNKSTRHKFDISCITLTLKETHLGHIPPPRRCSNLTDCDLLCSVMGRKGTDPEAIKRLRAGANGASAINLS